MLKPSLIRILVIEVFLILWLDLDQGIWHISVIVGEVMVIH